MGYIMADIFDEVSEELKQDQLVQLWKKYSKYIITFFILLVLSVLTYQAYMVWNEKKLTASSEQFFSGLEKLDDKDFEKSAKIFFKNSSEQKGGYKVYQYLDLLIQTLKMVKFLKWFQTTKQFMKTKLLEIIIRI